jgi:hypothetical protein
MAKLLQSIFTNKNDILFIYLNNNNKFDNVTKYACLEWNIWVSSHHGPLIIHLNNLTNILLNNVTRYVVELDFWAS